MTENLLIILTITFFLATTTFANNIQISNVLLTDQNTADGYWLVQFDLQWENSWRTDNLFPGDGHDAGNWDAAWVFIKYRIGEGEWRHAKLHNSGHSSGSGTPASLQIGVPDEQAAFDPAGNPGTGAFIYRSQNSTGTFSTTGIKVRWNYGADEIPDGAQIDIMVFAIEMVYVAAGPFNAGSGGTEVGRFFAGGTTGNPFLVTDSWDKSIADTIGSLWGSSTSGKTSIGGPGLLNQNFPTGTDGFYSMKYSISQQQYVDFLNSLTYEQQDSRVEGNPSDAPGTYVIDETRHAIKIMESGIPGALPAVYETDHPYLACNFLSWMDGAAYADWAGLRPMTELEFEKASRGPADPVANEYAWGSTSITQATDITNGGQTDEIPTPAGANANYDHRINPAIGAPIRVGSFAGISTTRQESGATYWGIMEMSGNLWERTVTVGSSEGRGFTGKHGDGALSAAGHGNVAAWPGGGSGGITGAAGIGFRGGSWRGSASLLRISDRDYSSEVTSTRDLNNGFRGVRSVPVAVGENFSN